MARSKANSQHHSPTRSPARTIPRNPARLFSFRRARLPSTCSKATPIAAINFEPSFKRSRNEKEVQNAKTIQVQTQETPRHRGASAASNWRGHRRLWRARRAKHETLARVVDRAPAARRRSRGHHRLQRDQNASGIAAVVTNIDNHRRRAGRDETANHGRDFDGRTKNERENASESERLRKNLRRRERR